MTTDRTKLDELVAVSKKLLESMTPEQKEAMLKGQAESWARAESSWPKPNYHWENGVKIYHSFEDYCND